MIKLGYEVNTGKEVGINPSHLIVTGITQLSGKTTTLEALIKRSGLKAVIFKTKIGEKSFTEGTEIAPFFRDRSDYEFVKSLIEAYAKEKTQPGIYEISFARKLTNLTFEEQKKKIPKGFNFTHPAILCEAIMSHYKETGERLLEDWYSRTDILSSHGFLVDVGDFDSDGVLVFSHYLPDDSGDDLGVSFSRRIGDLKSECGKIPFFS